MAQFDLQDFAEQLRAARKAEHTVDGITFRVDVPNDYQVRSSTDNGGGGNAALRAVIDAAITGWTGCRQRSFWSGAPTDGEVPFSPAAMKLLLDHRGDIVDELAAFIGKWRGDEQRRLEEARKNSSPASSGT